MHVTEPGWIHLAIEGFGGDCGDYVLTVEEVPLPSCPPESAVSQPPSLPEDPWNELVSDVAAGALAFDNYELPAAMEICAVRWWGFSTIPGAWEDCFENPMDFEITFYWDDAGQPGAPACSYLLTDVWGEDTGLDYNGVSLYEYNAPLEPCCPLPGGWISIQATSAVAPDCLFHWVSSPFGDGLCWYEMPAGAEPMPFDLAMCLIAFGGPADHMWLDGPPVDPIWPPANPIGPWHELWPVFCTQWECTDWIDNGNGFLDHCDYVLLGVPFDPPSWWHVQNTTITVRLEPMPGADQPVFMDWVGPYIPLNYFEPFGAWHEIYPDFCMSYHCVEWIDNGNGILDECDVLGFLFLGGNYIELHVEEVNVDIEVVREDPPPPPIKYLDAPFDPLEPLPDPLGPWHELWPEFCTQWDAIDWIDNGTGELDVSDFLLLATPGADPAWWHVDVKTITIVLEPDIGAPPETWRYRDWVGPAIPIPFTPIGPWHEIHPDFCAESECIDWIDSNANGLVDFCDWLVFEDPTGAQYELHVIEMRTDITVSQSDPPPPPKLYLDNPDLNPYLPLFEPFGPWHELWPVFCNMWECVGWIDNGSMHVNECDYVLLHGPAGPPTWWHVEHVTPTVELAAHPGTPPIAWFDWDGPWPTSLPFPLGFWHIVLPPELHCVGLTCVAWDDIGPVAGELDPGDWLIFELPGGITIPLHVNGLGTDLIVVESPPPCPADINGDGVVDVLDLLHLLAHWSHIAPCPADINGDGIVDVLDLLELLANWGPCP